jgi:hypothetical protein
MLFMVFFFLQIKDDEEGSDTGCDKARWRGPFGDEEEGFRKGMTQTYLIRKDLSKK